MNARSTSASQPRLALRLLASLRLWWPVLLLAALLFFGWHDLRAIDLNAIRGALHGLHGRWLLVAAGLTLVNLALLGCYDLLTLRGTPVPPAARWGSGMLAFAWSNFFTLGPIAGPAIRFWLYRPYEVSAAALRGAIVAGMVAFAAALGASLLAANLMPPALIAPFAAGLLLVAAGLLGRLERAERMPAWLKRGTKIWAALFMVALLDWFLAATVFIAVLRATGQPFAGPDAIRTFLAGQAVGMISLLPGGLGSADAFWLLRLPIETSQVGAALVAYRTIYYLGPWLAACLVLLWRGARAGARWLNPVPVVLALLVGGAGAILLISTASPEIERRLMTLKQWVPVGVVELSHFVGALVGLGLLLLARGMARGYREAHRLTVALLIAGAVAAGFKGLDYEEAFILLVLAAVTVSQSAQFRRTGRAPWVGWTALGLTVLAVGIFSVVGFRSYAATPYDEALWWTVGFGHAYQVARFLRTLAVLSVAATAFLLHVGLRAPAAFHEPDAGEIDRALAVHETSGRGTSAMMVASGDKVIFFEGERAFCSYRVVGSYLVVFSDPSVPAGEEPAFLEALTEHADNLDRRLIFYQIAASWLPLLHDHGFFFFKLGEEAIVDLGDFTLSGARWKPFRQAMRKVEEQEGFGFEVLAPDQVTARMADLRKASDEWLRGKEAREKQFSIGSFSEAYLQRFPCAVVQDAHGGIVAFANILCGPGRQELSIDLMRHTERAPDLVMDYLFIRLFEWGRAQGFQSFNLWMAPLAAVGELSGAPVWERLAHLLFRHGEGLYNFQGLRAYKAKFQPRWVPRYMAYPESWEWPFAAVQVSVLIAGGWRSLLRPGKADA